MEKLGCEMDDAIKSVTHIEYCEMDSSSVKVDTTVTFLNGYTTSESTWVLTRDFVNDNSAKEHCIQTNILSLKKRLDEVNDYLRFLNNNELTLINNKEFDEYVRLKTKKNKLESHSLLNKNFEVIGKTDDFEFENPDAKYVIVHTNELISLYKDRDLLTAIYKACIDNWIGGCDEAQR